MFDQELADKLRESLDMQLTFSTSALAAPVFATSSSDRSIINSFYVGDRLLVMAKLTVNADSELIGKAIRDLGRGEHIFVLSHERREHAATFPSADTVFEAGDQLTVQTEPATLKRLHEMNRDPKAILTGLAGHERAPVWPQTQRAAGAGIRWCGNPFPHPLFSGIRSRIPPRLSFLLLSIPV